MLFSYIIAQIILTMVHIKRIFTGSRVKGPHCPLVANPNGGTRRVREKVYGTVIKAIGTHKWEVQFDFDGISKEVTSKSLSLVEEEAGVPVDEVSVAARRCRDRCICVFAVVVLDFPRPH